MRVYCDLVVTALEHESIRLLVLDDHPRLRQILAAGIRKATGVLVDEAATLDEALTLLGSRTYAALLSDVNLDDTNAIDVLPAFRRAQPGIRIVLMSGAPADDMRARVLAAGADDFVPKSAGIAALTAAALPPQPTL